MGITSNAERKWWDEDADRVNKLAEHAKKKKMTIKVGPRNPPKINKDGSIDEFANR